MIELYTTVKKIPSMYKLIVYPDAVFDTEMGDIGKLTKEELMLIEELEGLKFVEGSSGLLEGRLGRTSLENISTGLKTVLILSYMGRNNKQGFCVNITECGPNYLDYAFEYAYKGGIPVLLRHKFVLGTKDREIMVNGNKVVRTTRRLLGAISRFDELYD